MKRLEAEAQAAAAAEKPRREEADAERQRTGTKRRGREPGPIVETPADKAQTNFTAPELSIMATANKGWEVPAATRRRAWMARARSSWRVR